MSFHKVTKNYSERSDSCSMITKKIGDGKITSHVRCELDEDVK